MFAVQLHLMHEIDEKWMKLAVSEAAKARDRDEVPIGACVIGENGELLASAFNRTITDNDPTAHAEILALREAARKVNNYRLTGATIYSTIEPCAMCAGALVNARVKRLVYGADDERFGAVRTHFGIGVSDVLNHRIEVVSGIRDDECRAMMQEFFRARRANRSKSGDIETGSPFKGT
jgi:tRNA(adenine34) deaminase